MIITKIERQKKRMNRYSVFIDDEFAFGVDENTLIKHNIQKGQALTPVDIERIQGEEIIEQAKQKALNLLALRPRTRHEIKTRLYPMEEGDIETVLAYLDSYDYLDDFLFAELFIRDALHLKGWGSRKIRYELRQKGVSADLIDRAIIPTEKEYQTGKEVLFKRLRTREWNQKEKNRTIQFMLQRGFLYPMIMELINEMEGTGSLDSTN